MSLFYWFSYCCYCFTVAWESGLRDFPTGQLSNIIFDRRSCRGRYQQQHSPKKLATTLGWNQNNLVIVSSTKESIKTISGSLLKWPPLSCVCVIFVLSFYQALHRVKNFPLARRARGKKRAWVARYGLLEWCDLLCGMWYVYFSDSPVCSHFVVTL